MIAKSRARLLSAILKNEPDYRLDQVNRALFNTNNTGWDCISTLPKKIKEELKNTTPWISITPLSILESALHDTYKAVLETLDRKRFESVLMKNRRDYWTICVSSQIGCAMECSFCATGTMGLERNLESDEIIDQYRLWQNFLKERPDLPQQISNVVFMGMGEPMANYENVKNSIITWLKYTSLGPTRITVSTVGVLSQLNKLLTDKKWPPIRIAISLHSANEAQRKKIVPTTPTNFLSDIAKWSQQYKKTLANRRLMLTFEYTLINKINDSPEHAHELAAYIKKTAVSKINIIPYNPVLEKRFTKSSVSRLQTFKNILRSYNIDVTERRTMGDDITAACGQLVWQ